MVIESFLFFWPPSLILCSLVIQDAGSLMAFLVCCLSRALGRGLAPNFIERGIGLAPCFEIPLGSGLTELEL
jgi:hypothetical protein